MTHSPPRPNVADGASPKSMVPTVAAAIAAVRSWDDVPGKRRITVISALRMLEGVYGAPPEAIRLEPEELTRRFLKASPAMLGIAASSLSVYKGHIRMVLRRYGLIQRPRRRDEPLMPAWHALRDSLPDMFVSIRLQAFMAWCSDRGIAPDAVRDGTLAEYAAYLRLNRMRGDPHEVARRCAKAWNRAGQTVLGWPSAELTAPASTFYYTLAFDAFPASLVADIETFRRRLKGGGGLGLYSSTSAFRSLRPVSVANRMQALRMALAALVQSGVKPEDIRLLADLVTSDHMKMILDWHWERAGRKVTGNLGAVADTLRIVAKYQVGLTGAALEEALAIAKAAKPKKRTRMTAKNEIRLAQFDDPDVLAMTVNLAREALMPLAAAQKAAGRHLDAAWTASIAVAVEILLHCPMRLANLANLRLGHEIVCLGKGRQRYTHFLIAGHLTKNDEPLRWKINLRLSEMIDVFAREYRGAIGGADGSDYQFAGRDHHDRPRWQSQLGTAITRAFREHVGIEMHPHLYRALAGKLILDENPGAIEEVRQLLGHRTFTTAMEYYISSQPQRAAERHDVRISGLQLRTKTLARVAFSNFRAPGRTAIKGKGANGGGSRV